MNFMKWQLWFHYAVLVGIIFTAHAFSGWIEVMTMSVQWYTMFFGWIGLLLWYYVWVALGDILIHLVLKATTRWND